MVPWFFSQNLCDGGAARAQAQLKYTVVGQERSTATMQVSDVRDEAVSAVKGRAGLQHTISTTLPAQHAVVFALSRSNLWATC
jgi:hypothetical protein